MSRGLGDVYKRQGRGFSGARSAYGTGLRTAVVARMRAVGGRAEISSSPGRGTVVEVTWEASVGPAPDGTAEWQLRTFAPIMALGAIVLTVNVVRGYDQWSQWRPLGIAIGCIAAIVAATLVATLLRPRRLNWAPHVLLIVATVLVAALATPAGAVIDWRYWYLGALAPAIAATAYRFTPGVGLATGGIVAAVVAVVDAASGRSAVDPLAGSVPVLIAVTIGAHLMRRGMDDAWRRVEEATRANGEIRLTIAVEEERAEEADARVAAMAGTAVAALERIALGGAMTAGDAQDWDLLESSVRDQLVAPALVDGAMVRSLRTARSRGVVVDVIAHDEFVERPERTEGAAGPFRAVLDELLASAPHGTRVRVVWNSGSALGKGTISAVGSGLQRVQQRLAALSGAHDQTQVSHDEESVLVRFDA